jgi:hypothetical protein
VYILWFRAGKIGERVQINVLVFTGTLFNDAEFSSDYSDMPLSYLSQKLLKQYL